MADEQMFRDAANCAAPWWRSREDELLAVIESYHEGEFQMNTLVEPISIEAVEKTQAAIEALEAYHKDTYEAYDEEGWLERVYPCNNCELCQAIRAMKLAVNSIFTVVGNEPVYKVD